MTDVTFKWMKKPNDPNVFMCATDQMICEVDEMAVGGYIVSASAYLPFVGFDVGIVDCETEDEARSKVESLSRALLAAHKEWKALHP